MNRIFLFAAAPILGLSAVAAVAQTGVSTANQMVAAQMDSGQRSAVQRNADAQAAYEADLATYQQSLRDNHEVAEQDQQHYQRQRRAYAQAMAAWRAQVDACHRGNDRACNAPTPNPADFW